MSRSTKTDALYPDVVAAGGLPGALTRALAELGSPVCVRRFDDMPAFSWFATVEHDGRVCPMHVAAKERAFSCDFWHRGVQHGSGCTSSLAEAARAIDGFCRGRVDIVELHERHGWIEVHPAATLPDAAALVDHRWTLYLAADATIEPLAPLLAATARRPRLRALLPFMSMHRLCFSRTTGYPYSSDCPSAWPIDGDRYRVVAATGDTLGDGDADAAAEMLEAALPVGCGPAREGTAEDPEPN